ncbi:hypothetical protein COHA_003696 [Chlorella ohadii]|uniref:CRAL-TRIO domain-containing protein n=1 Tax=Chlorella ohadii TaxID=2649997 RepID=A0AAD5DRV8_9CHLO|nr:hypothetical protein COHA_003696 [Chlorella ohadii]
MSPEALSMAGEDAGGPAGGPDAAQQPPVEASAGVEFANAAAQEDDEHQAPPPAAGRDAAARPLEQSDAQALHSCVVRFKVLRGEEEKAAGELNSEERALETKFNNRAYLMVLTPEAAELYATRKADFARDDHGDGEVEGSGGSEGTLAAMRAAVMDPLQDALPEFVLKGLQLGPRAVKRGMKAGMAGASRMADCLVPRTAAAAKDQELLARPDEVEADGLVTLVIALSQILDVRQSGASILVTFRRQKPRIRLTARAQKYLLTPWADITQDPSTRTCVLKLCDEAAASELAAAFVTARERLHAAVQWLSRGLPLLDAPAPTLVTATAAGGNACGAGAEVLAVAPAWGSPILLPQKYQQAAPLVAAGAVGPAFSVFLSTPLGPAKAEFCSLQLADAYRDGRRPLTVEAQLLLPDSNAAAAASAGQLRVLVQAGVEKAKGLEADDPPADADGPAQPRSGDGHIMLLAVGGVVAAVLAAWLQLLLGSGAADRSLPQWAAFLACNAAALLVLLLLLNMQRSQQRARRAGAAPQEFSWVLKLLQATLVAAGKEPLLQQVAAEAGVAGPAAGKAGDSDQLPDAYRSLIQKYSGILDANIAYRFLATYPSANKGYTALAECVFSLIKRHYPHAVLGYSRKKDCLVTLDSYGVWKRSFEALKAEGVTDDELLRHLMLCMDFYFGVLDTRPWPHGKSVNIVDLSGLKMSDAAGEAFRFISKAGSESLTPDKAAAREALLEWIDEDVLPTEYGGTSTAGIYDNELEQRFWAHVASRNEASASGGASGKEGVEGSESLAAVDRPGTPPAGDTAR